MGRRKGYDREDLVGKAVDLFRVHGFANTSADMLVAKLGVNRYSLYAEFGNKKGLFDAALGRYNDDVIGKRFGPLEHPGAGLAEIRLLLESYGRADDSLGFNRGCLLCNTAVEFGPKDQGGTGFVQCYFDRLSSAFRAALEGAQAAGQLKADADPGLEAAHLTATVLGLFVMLRAKAPAAMIRNAVSVAIRHLDGLES